MSQAMTKLIGSPVGRACFLTTMSRPAAMLLLCGFTTARAGLLLHERTYAGRHGGLDFFGYA